MKTDAIPKRIVQFWLGNRVLHTVRSRAVMSNVTLLNPGYECLFLDDAQSREFIEREWPAYRSVFYSFEFPIQRCDFLRYLLIYRHGGFYFDLDLLLASPLSALLEHGCVFPFETLTLSDYMRNQLGMDWQVGNYAFGATPGHPFLEAIIENCVRAQRDPDWVKPMMRGTPPFIKDEFHVINSTGPGLVSRTLAENPELAKTVTILFPDDVCDVRQWNLFGDYGVHLATSSWRPDRSFVRRKVTDYCWRWLQNRRVQQSSRLGKIRHHPSSCPSFAKSVEHA